MERTELRHKIEKLLACMQEGAYERGEVIGLALLSSLAGESIFLLGLPGVGKSMVSRRLKMAFKESRSFEYLMSRFSTPDEIFGPVSISKLKDGDTYERVVDGYLPTADIVFLDEIWKAGPAIQNSLLTVLNEKIFHNGKHDIKLPLKGVISASNELPAEGEGLEALWDRFIMRYVVEPIKETDNFVRLLTDSEQVCEVPDDLKVTSEEFEDIQKSAKEIDVPGYVIDVICDVRNALSEARKKAEETTEANENEEETDVPYISDRRWRKIAGLLRCSALLNGRERVDMSDCLLMEHALWDNDSQKNSIRTMLSQAIAKQCKRMSLADVGELMEVDNTLTKNLGTPVSPDGVHYIIMAAGEKIYIDKNEYAQLTEKAKNGYIDDENILHVTDEGASFTVRRNSLNTITINNFVYKLQMSSVLKSGSVSDMVDILDNGMETTRVQIMEQITDNLFLGDCGQYVELHAAMKNVVNGIKKLKY